MQWSHSVGGQTVLPGQKCKTFKKKKKTERKPKVVQYLYHTCMRSGEANIDQNSTITQSGPAGDRCIVGTL